MKFLEFKTRNTKIIKIVLFLSESQKKMKFIEFPARVMKTIKSLIRPRHNNANH